MESSTIDWSRISELREEVGPEDFEEVADLFLEEVDEVMTRLQAGANPAALEEELHFLKGSALNLGFTLMGHICQLGEKAAADNRQDEFDLQQLFVAYTDSKLEFLSKEKQSVA